MSAENSELENPGLLVRMLQRIQTKFTPFHIWIFRTLSGRVVNRTGFGAPVLLVTTIGRRSGKPRTVALGHLRVGDDVIVMGTNGGLPKLPAWIHNLRAHPHADVELGLERFSAFAEFLEGEEWQQQWNQLITDFPIYDDARRWSGRRIPLVRLRKASVVSG